MKILVIGGTRFIGLYVVQSLLENGHSVHLFNRSGPSVFDGRVQWHKGDRNDESGLGRSLMQVRPDVVLDMIPVTGAQASILVRAADGRTPRIVTVSSMDVYRAYGCLLGIEPPGTPLEAVPFPETAPLRSVRYPYRGAAPRNADDPAKPMDDYDKIPVEEAVMNAGRIAGTVLRLPIVYGPYDAQHRMYEILKRIQDRRPAIILDESYAQWRTSRGYAANVAEAVALAVTSDAAAGRIFNVADSAVWSGEEWTRLIASATGWDGRILVTAPEMTPVHLRAGMNTRQHLVADTSRIRDELGFTERVPAAEAIRRTIEWEIAHPPDMPPGRLAALFDYDAEDALLREPGVSAS